MGADLAPAELASTLRRVRLVATQTLLEAIRLKLAVLLALAGGALVLMSLWLRVFNFGAAESKFITDFGLGAISLLGTLLAALATAQLFFDDMESGFAACVLAKAVRRWEYLAGRLLGVFALLALFVLALGLVLGVLVGLRGWPHGAAFVPLPVFLQACALVWLKISLVAAMTLLVCSYAGSALFASCAGLMLVAIAHVRAFAGDTGGWNWLRLWPDLGLFDVDPLLSTGRGLGLGQLASVGGYWLVFTVLLAGLAAYAFKHREL